MPDAVERPFFIRSATQEDGVLRGEMGSDLETWGTIEFQFVRAVLFFKESDLWKRLADYQNHKLIDGGSRGVGVFAIAANPILGGIFEDVLIQEKPNCFWLGAADECMEVVGFSQPTLTLG